MGKPILFCLQYNVVYELTINAWITPGSQPIMVRTTLIKKVVPRPCCIKTANGGNKMFRIIVNKDIFVF